MKTKYYVIIGVAIIIAFLSGGGAGFYAHDCDDPGEQTVKLALDGTVPVEVTADCTSDPVEVKVTCDCTTNTSDNCPPKLKFEPARWSIGAAVGEYAYSTDFSYQFRPRWSAVVERVVFTDWPEIEKKYHRSWKYDINNDTETKWLAGVRYHGGKLASTTSTSP